MPIDEINERLKGRTRIVIECPHTETAVCEIGTQFLYCFHPQSKYGRYTRQDGVEESVCVLSERLMSRGIIPNYGEFKCPFDSEIGTEPIVTTRNIPTNMTEDEINKELKGQPRVVIECKSAETEIGNPEAYFLKCNHPKATYGKIEGENYIDRRCVLADRQADISALPSYGKFWCPLVDNDNFARGLHTRKVL